LIPPSDPNAPRPRTTAAFRYRSILLPALIALGAAAVYLPRLHDAPLYVMRDEVFSALTAHSVVSNGHDLNGRFLPLFFQMQMRFGSQMWFQPLLMYAIAFSIMLLPFSEATIRLPMALAGVADVVLMYFVARELFRRELPAIAAAAALALTPAHFIHSRIAMDFQAPLPFILGWLLCLLIYLRNNDRRLLFASGLALGIGLYSYIVAYMLVPIYAMLTCVVLFQRREPLNRYALLVLGLTVPALFCVPFLWTHPTVIQDIFWHYKRDEPQTLGALGLLKAFVTIQRLADAASLYASFWNPRFLFVNGPQGLWPVGVFLFPAAGFLAVGVARAVAGPAPYAVLLLGGLLSAPVAASLVDEPEAIRRAVAVLPFAVLLAIGGFEYLRTNESTARGRMVFVAAWGTLVVLAAAYHDVFPRAQAMVRASTVPLAVAGMAVLLRHFAIDRAGYWRAAAVAATVIGVTHIAYFFVDYSTTVGVWLLAAIAVATLTPDAAAGATRRPLLVVALLAMACSHFLYVYVGYANLPRVAFIPPAAVLLAARCVFASLALICVVGVAAMVELAARDRDWRQLTAATLDALVCAQDG
jgi:4-amino-4-deoxy-L-arabinose transferase-like glycosyltransferase